MKKLYPLLFLFLLFSSVSLSAQLALWDFDGEVLTATTVVPQATADDASAVGVGNTGDFFTCDNEAWSPNSWTTSSSVDVSNDYAVYTITANAESSLAISSFVFTGRRSGSGPTQYEVRSSDDNYASVLSSGTVSTTCLLKGGSLPATIYLVSGESVTFRIYGFNASGGGNMRMENVTIGGTALPVELTKFNATKRADKVNLAWQTATEINNDRFEIQRSHDGNRFESIGKVYGEGNSQKLVDYSFVDDAPLSGVNYYRLKQVDIDGAFEYSDIASVKMDKAANIRITPTSTLDYVTVNTGEASSIMVRSINGQVMNSQTDAEGNFTVDMANYPQGIYYLTIQISGTVQTEKVVRL